MAALAGQAIVRAGAIMDDIDQLTLRPAPTVRTPHCLTKGGETKPGYTAKVTADYFRATFQRQDAGEMYAMFGGKDPEPLGKAKGYRYAERHRSGWVRQFKPYTENLDGLKDYETWEMPGAVEHDELRTVVKGYPKLKMTQLHVAFDFIGQGYPRPWELRELLQDSKPRTKRPRGRRHEGEDGSQTWYLGKRSSTVAVRVYEKGKELRAKKESVDAPLDWVRFEFEVHEQWLLERLHSFLLMGEDDALAYVGEAIATYYFKGDTLGYLPDKSRMTLEPPAETYTPDLKTVYHAIRQYGPLLKELEKQGILTDLLALVRPSRTAEWRNRQVVEQVTKEGIKDALDGIEKLLYGQPRKEVAA